MSGFDKLALSDEVLEAWLAVKVNRRPLVRTVSALDGFATAALTGPPFPDPQYWICPAVGLPYEHIQKWTFQRLAPSWITLSLKPKGLDHRMTTGTTVRP